MRRCSRDAAIATIPNSFHSHVSPDSGTRPKLPLGQSHFAMSNQSAINSWELGFMNNGVARDGQPTLPSKRGMAMKSFGVCHAASKSSTASPADSSAARPDQSWLLLVFAVVTKLSRNSSHDIFASRGFFRIRIAEYRLARGRKKSTGHKQETLSRNARIWSSGVRPTDFFELSFSESIFATRSLFA